MNPNEPCPKCGSSQRIPTAEITTRREEHGLEVKVPRRPDAAMLKHMVYSGLKVIVCGNCGYLEWYATQPQSLLEAFREGEQHRLE
jgi:predicted nucleic-acid-binding Zn-ribbon protein